MYISQQDDIALVSCGSGKYDMTRWSAALIELNNLDCPVVVDVSEVNDSLSEIDAYLLALQAEELDSLCTYRIALVSSGAPGCHAAFFAVCSQNRGLKMELFNSVETASEWSRQTT